MAKVSFLDCSHRNVQQFTDYCLECGYNVNLTNSEYLAQLRDEEAELRKKEREKDPIVIQIRALEKKLGIGS